MTTVSRVSQVSHSNVTGTGEWDHRLNRLLEDLQGSVIPSDSEMGNANEYREFRMTQRTQVNDEPAQQVDEKWVEYGQTDRGMQPLSLTSDREPLSLTSNYGGGSGGSTRYGEKSVAFSDDLRSSSSSRFESSKSREPHVEFLAPANSTTVLKSGPSSPTPGYTISTSPKVERKEFYAKASYTTLIKGPGEYGGMPQLTTSDNRAERLLDDLIPPDFRTTPAIQSSSSETKRSYMSESTRRGGELPLEPERHLGQPLYASTPLSSKTTTRDTRDYSREMITDRTRSVTPPPRPSEALKTPPMIRKILQSSSQQQASSSSYHQHQKQSTTSSTSATTSSGRPPVGGVPLPILHSPSRDTRDHIPNYDDPPVRPGAQYYTSSTTTHHRTDREMSPVKRFPSPHPSRGAEGEPPKRLDELLATFGDTSYSESSSTRYAGDGAGPHKSIPYGPGTHPIQALRSVRIDDNVQQRQIDEDAELIHRKDGSRKSELDGTRNMAGPPVYFPPGQIFQKTEEDALMASQEGGKGKGKMKMERKYKAGEKMKSKHSEKGGGGAVPVPVCLPVCCAAPCVIM